MLNIGESVDLKDTKVVCIGLSYESKDYYLDMIAIPLKENNKAFNREAICAYLFDWNDILSHSSDDRTDMHENDDETITINLFKVPNEVAKIILLVYNTDKAKDANISLYKDCNTIAQYKVNNCHILVCEFYKNNNWEFKVKEECQDLNKSFKDVLISYGLNVEL